MCPMNIPKDLFFTDIWRDKIMSYPYFAEIKHKDSSLFVMLDCKTKFGLKFGFCPYLTPYNAIFVHPENEMKPGVAFNVELALYQKLINHHFPFSVIQLMFPIKNVQLPLFKNQKIVSTIAFTEVINNTISIAAGWNQLSSEVRNDIKFAEQHSNIDDQYDLEEIVNFLLTNPHYSKTGLTKKILINLFIELKELNVIKTLILHTNEQLISVAIFVKSQDTLHYLMSANNKDKTLRGANLALIWKGIQIALENNLDFNFNGTSNPNLIKVFKSFGSETFVYPESKIFSSRLVKNISFLLNYC